MKEKYIITGGAGFIGSHMVKKLLFETTAEIHVLKKSTSNIYRLESCLSKIHLHNCDLTDYEALNKIINSIKPQYLLHFAISNNYKKGLLDTQDAFYHNQRIILNILELGRNFSFKKIICAGGSTIYDNKLKPLFEDSQFNPLSTRGINKLTERNIIIHCTHQYNLPVYIPIIFRAYGEFEQEDRLLIRLFNSAFSGVPIKLVNKRFHKDYIYIEDLTDGLYRLLHADLPYGTEINFGSGKQYNVLEVVSIIERITQKKIKISLDELETNRDNENWIASTSKATKMLGWKPTTSLEDGLSKMYQWYLKEHRT